MSTEVERRALALYASALDLPAAERAPFLRAAAAGEAELLELLLRMLAVEAPSVDLQRTSSSVSLVAALHLEGRLLGDFRLGRELGGGAVGRVFEAQQVSLRRRVAVKVLRLEHCRNEELLRRFGQEPVLQGRHPHPNIVQVLGTGCEDGWHYFAMEFIDGPSLAKLLERHGRGASGALDGGPAPAATAFDLDSHLACAALVEKVARALHFAHEQGLVHRDVKPHNILIDRTGEPYLSDFGLAKAIDRDTLTAAMGDGLRGTLAYMSPEQATEFHAVDARADVYSLGAVLYELLTRVPPFEAETSVQLLQKILSPSNHVRPPHHFLRGFDPRLSAICTTALQKDPARRFASALELAESLRAVREDRPVESRPISRLEQIGERRLDRRVLVRGAAVGLPLLGGALLAGRRLVHARAPASLRLELPPGCGPVSVRLIPIAPPDGHLGSPRELGRFPAGAAIRGIEPGSYRVVVSTGDGAFTELQRSFGAQGSITARALPSPARDPGATMARVGGANARLHLPGVGPVELACEPFWIDRSPVTNREFRAFLEDTGQWPLPEWSPRWLDVWNDLASFPRPKDWDDLPVVSVSWLRARAFAEWKGKRLPTLAEWWLALGLAGGEPGSAAWGELARRFALGRPAQESLGGGPPTTQGAYLVHARPARLAEDQTFGPHRLWHAFGNVGHWLESASFRMTDSGVWTESGNRYEAMGAWHFAPLRDDQPWEGIIGLRPEADAAGDLGFRCAKTAT